MDISNRYMRNDSSGHKLNIDYLIGEGIWCPLQAYQFLELDHHIHSLHEKNFIERIILHIKDRIESFYDYFLYRKEIPCNLFHIKNWINLFVNIHNREVINA